MDRLEKLLFGIKRTARILEVGPSHNPVAPKAAGWQSFVLDHATQADLKEIYREHGVALDRIEPVDFVWAGGAIHDAVPATQHGTFDACIASHVLEHLPDPISFFQSLDHLLNEHGIVSLAIPDKRFCFDYFRPLTLAPAWIEAFEHKASRHSRRTVLEATAYKTANGDHIAWGQFDNVRVRLLGQIDSPNREANAADPTVSAPYVDCHAWCFTPSSFELLILEIGMLGLIGFHIDRLFPTVGHEFFALLRKRRERYGPDVQSKRLELLKATVDELGDQDRRMKKWFKPRIVHRGIGKLGRIMKAAARAVSPSK
jgi:SAM-dependent methyltransferase